MNDQALQKLLRSAAQARPAETAAGGEPPFGFATRVVAQWRFAARSGSLSAATALWFRRAFLCSCAVALLSVAWCFQADTAASSASASGDEMAIASYDTSIDLP